MEKHRTASPDMRFSSVGIWPPPRHSVSPHVFGCGGGRRFWGNPHNAEAYFSLESICYGTIRQRRDICVCIPLPHNFHMRRRGGGCIYRCTATYDGAARCWDMRLIIKYSLLCSYVYV